MLCLPGWNRQSHHLLHAQRHSVNPPTPTLWNLVTERSCGGVLEDFRPWQVPGDWHPHHSSLADPGKCCTGGL